MGKLPLERRQQMSPAVSRHAIVRFFWAQLPESVGEEFGEEAIEVAGHGDRATVAATFKQQQVGQVMRVAVAAQLEDLDLHLAPNRRGQFGDQVEAVQQRFEVLAGEDDPAGTGRGRLRLGVSRPVGSRRFGWSGRAFGRMGARGDGFGCRHDGWDLRLMKERPSAARRQPGASEPTNVVSSGQRTFSRNGNGPKGRRRSVWAVPTSQ